MHRVGNFVGNSREISQVISKCQILNSLRKILNTFCPVAGGEGQSHAVGFSAINFHMFSE